MKKLTLILIFTLFASTLAFAHGNLAHVLGTVVAVTDHSLSVKTSDGSIKVVAFDAETHFIKGEFDRHRTRRCDRKPGRDSRA